MELATCRRQLKGLEAEVDAALQVVSDLLHFSHSFCAFCLFVCLFVCVFVGGGVVTRVKQLIFFTV